MHIKPYQEPVKDCETCDDIEYGEFPYRSDLWVAKHLRPAAFQGQMLVIPTRHINDIRDVTPQERRELSSLTFNIHTVIRKELCTNREFAYLYTANHTKLLLVACPYNVPPNVNLVPGAGTIESHVATDDIEYLERRITAHLGSVIRDIIQ